MNKKFLLIVLSILIVCMFCACGEKQSAETDSKKVSSTNDVNKSESEENISGEDTDVDSNKKPSEDNPNSIKLKGEIEHSTDFVNGKAFVKIKGDFEKNYCIDKNGIILFEIDPVIWNEESHNRVFVSGFYHGITLISDNFGMYCMVCDENGKIVKAEELGVSAFYADPLKDGYILALVDGKSGEKDKIGFLNSSLEWVVEPSAEIERTLDVYGHGETLCPYYYDYVLYGYGGGVDVRTGEICKETFRTFGKEHGSGFSENWYSESGDYYYGNTTWKKKMLDLEKDNFPAEYSSYSVSVDGASFVNGKAPVLFSLGSGYGYNCFSLMDETGTLIWKKAVEVGFYIDYITINGNYILVVSNGQSQIKAKTYDLNGNLVGEIELSANTGTYEFSFSDEMVKITLYGMVAYETRYTTNFYGVDFKPAF